MKIFLLHLLLASLLLAPVHCLTPFERFKALHTYKKLTGFDCTRAMNAALSKISEPCRPCNSFILGNDDYRTPLNNVINICRGEGTPVGFNNFRSNIMFRTVTCIKDGGGAWPPNCQYRARPIQTSQITVGCSGGNPIHFEKC